MCDVLTETMLDGSSKANEWLKSGHFSTGCNGKQGTNAEDSLAKKLCIKSGNNGVRANIESHHHSHHRHRNAKLHRTKTGGNFTKMGRFGRTAIALRQSGLLQITETISRLLKSNDVIQQEIDRLQEETIEYSRRLQRQLQKKLEAENEMNGSCNQEGQVLLSKLSQSLL